MKKQPKLVILHVGTNDIQRKEPDEIVAEMKSLCQGIVSQSLSKIAIAQIGYMTLNKCGIFPGKITD
jgi:hypothetical protein